MKNQILADEWLEVCLENLGTTYTGLSGKTKDDFGSGKPFITYMNIFTNSKVDPRRVDYVNVSVDEKQNRVQYGDVFFTTSSETAEEVGMSSVLLHHFDEAYLNSFCFGFRLHDFTMLIPEYARYLFRSEDVRKTITVLAQGSTRYNLSKNTLLKRLKFKLPTIPEQRKIAEILSTIDDKILVIEEQIIANQELKKGLMQKLLTKGIGHTQFVNSPLGEIPENWFYGKIADFCNVHNNLRKPISAEVRKGMQGEYPYYGPTGIVDYINEYLIDGEYTLIGEDGDHFLKYESWSMTNLVSGRFNVNNHAHLIQGKDGCLTSWVHVFFQHRNIVPFLTRQGAGRYKLTKETLLQLPMLLPPIDEQKKIVEIIFTVDSKREVLKNKKDCFLELKKGLMQQLLTGKIRVNQTNKPNERIEPSRLQPVVEG